MSGNNSFTSIEESLGKYHSKFIFSSHIFIIFHCKGIQIIVLLWHSQRIFFFVNYQNIYVFQKGLDFQFFFLFYFSCKFRFQQKILKNKQDYKYTYVFFTIEKKSKSDKLNSFTFCDLSTSCDLICIYKLKRTRGNNRFFVG